MATTVTSAWNTKPGAWALDSEEQEAMEALQLQQPQQQQQQQQSSNASVSDFPSLSDAVTSKLSRKKKSNQTLSLAEFTTGRHVSHGSAKTKGLTPDELLLLPTGPRPRTDQELQQSSSRLGGAFQSYGSGSTRMSNGDDSGSRSRWGSGFSSRNEISNEEPRRSGSSRDPPVPSRADEIDDWAAAKKSASSPAHERRERGGFFDSQSRADESDTWLSTKSFAPSESRRSGGGFEGFKERKGGFNIFQKDGADNGIDSDTWGKKREEGTRIADSDTWGRKSEEMSRVSHSDTWGKKREEANGRPRLVLQPRTQPGSNGEQQQQPGSGTRAKGSNPFGEARPREEVLAEKGQDWKKIDEQLESMKIKEMGPARPVSSEGPSFGKKSFGTGNGRAYLPDDRTERDWRKADSADITPRTEKSENDEKSENGEAENN